MNFNLGDAVWGFGLFTCISCAIGVIACAIQEKRKLVPWLATGFVLSGVILFGVKF